MPVDLFFCFVNEQTTFVQAQNIGKQMCTHSLTAVGCITTRDIAKIRTYEPTPVPITSSLSELFYLFLTFYLHAPPSEKFILKAQKSFVFFGEQHGGSLTPSVNALYFSVHWRPHLFKPLRPHKFKYE